MMPLRLSLSLAVALFGSFGLSGFVDDRAVEVVARAERVEWRPDNPPRVLEGMVGAIFEQEDVPRYPLPLGQASPQSIRQRELEERQMLPDDNVMQLGPAFSMSNCIFCRPELGDIADDTDAHAILNYMTPTMFRSYMKGSSSGLKDKCVFYTKAIPNTSGLSEASTNWACRSRTNALYTIWHLFPNSVDAAGNPGVRDFYCLWDQGDHWLAPVRDAAIRFTRAGRTGASPAINYFQAMSQSMAEACSGRIVIFTWTPTELYEYRPGGAYERFNNIFWSHERPVLRDHVFAGNAELFVVDANDPMGGARQVTNTRTFTVGPLKPLNTWWKRDTELAALNETFSMLLQRDMCDTTGLASQKPGMDYFNDAEHPQLPAPWG
ncbi:hypothetical protein ACRALDRAFT_1079697 [Sodiomyces alcalophilus JCM 7366]|uniref:uncharacterized protein n=1 Tax=Sodiomyces alcalophilus JCM 7366 TaxID=591952 RepID=UPI0039B48B05